MTLKYTTVKSRAPRNTIQSERQPIEAHQDVGITAFSRPLVKITDPEVVEALEKLLKNQDPLGDEFEKVWDENTDTLFKK